MTLILNITCPECGTTYNVEAARVWNNDHGGVTGIFGSAADFCEKCDAPIGDDDAVAEVQ